MFIKRLGFSPTPSSINEVDFSEMKDRKMLVQHPSLRESPLGNL